MIIRFLILFLLLISCTNVDKSLEDNAVTEENRDICEDINNLEIEIYKAFASLNILDLANYDGKDIYTWAKEYQEDLTSQVNSDLLITLQSYQTLVDNSSICTDGVSNE